MHSLHWYNRGNFFEIIRLKKNLQFKYSNKSFLMSLKKNSSFIDFVWSTEIGDNSKYFYGHTLRCHDGLNMSHKYRRRRAKLKVFKI